jgi:hypothetical protein
MYLLPQWFRSSGAVIESRINSVSIAYPLQFPKGVYCGTTCVGTVLSELAISSIRSFNESTEKLRWYPATYDYDSNNPTWKSGWRGNTFVAYFIVFGH